MRRWIFAALVLVNLGLFMWGWFYLEADRPAVPEAQPQIHPEKMRLLTEGAPGPPAARPKPPPPIAKTEASPDCYRLGPLLEPVQAQRIEAALAGIPLSFTRRAEATRTVTGYRVYLPPFPSKEDAERRRRELTRLGFKDHALMHEEGFENAISLGLFSVETNAQKRFRELAQKGVHQAKLQAIEQSGTVYWIDLAPVADPAPDLRARLKTLLEGISGAEVRQLPCVAPSAPTPPA